MTKSMIGLIFIIVVYLVAWPVPVDPVAWNAPHNRGYSGDFKANNKLANLQFVDLAGQHGPEDFALSPNGDIAMAMHSGDILLFDPATKNITTMVNTGGRPLGIEYDGSGQLIVADAILGLLSINKDSQVQILADSFDGILLTYVDDLDIDFSGKIYFSDASSKFAARDWHGTLDASLLDILEHGGHGRVFKYDPGNNALTLLVDGLDFANGIAVSHDQQSILINETGTYRVLRHWIAGPRTGDTEVVIDNLPGFPDNIARDPERGYWLGLASPRSAALDAMSSYPWLRKVVQRLPAFMRPAAQHYGHVVRIDESGNVLENLQDPQGSYPMTTGALRVGNTLYISSLTAPALAILER